MNLRTFLLAAVVFASALRAEVRTLRVPDGGIQPQAIAGSDGRIHLLYFKGHPGHGDLFYTSSRDGQTFAPAIQVNSYPGDAIAIGNIRGAHLSLGRNGRVHVAWMGMESAPQAEINGKKTTPMLYTRMKAEGSGFEKERNLLTVSAGLDGGGSLASDEQGNVYVTWHAFPGQQGDGEENRGVFMSVSRNEGESFATEKQISPKGTGACACCGMRAFADKDGNVYVVYRMAKETVNRDEVILVSPPGGGDFRVAASFPWQIGNCPMSSASFSQGAGKVYAAWETAGDVSFAAIDSRKPGAGPVIVPGGKARRKHPVLAADKDGRILFAWTEGMGWDKGGKVAWQTFDSKGKPQSKITSLDGVPTWSLVAAVSTAPNDFLVIY